MQLSMIHSYKSFKKTNSTYLTLGLGATPQEEL